MEKSIQTTLREAEDDNRTGRLIDAERKCHKILLRKPDDPAALKLASIVAYRLGKIHEAIRLAEQAVKAHPQNADLWSNLGEILRLGGMREKAAEALARAIELQPLEPAFHNGLGAIFFENRQYARALSQFEDATRLQPDDASAWSNKAGVLREMGQLDKAATAMEECLRLQPELAPSHLNMAIIHSALGRFDAAMQSTQRAIELKPDYAEAHYNLGLLRLLLGDLEGGWPEFQYRPGFRPKMAVPMWRGEDLRRKSILIYEEQGYGDTIHFVRYVVKLKQQGVQAWLGCRPELAALLEHVVPVVQTGKPMPTHDFWCPLLSLPMLFGTTLETIPADVPYIRIEPKIKTTGKFRVGLAWSGSSTNKDNARRSVSFKDLAPILNVPNVEFVNLQVGPSVGEADGSAVVRPDVELRDFHDTAQVIAGLDLVIGVDTVVVHLAGAMGKPVWALLRKVPDWRWFLDRSDSPWYPTMRLFRQKQPGEWELPIQQAAQELLALAKSAR